MTTEASVLDAMRDIVGVGDVLVGDEISDDYSHDEALTAEWRRPDAVVRPHSADHVAEILRAANETGTPVTARGSGTGLSGGAIARNGGVLVAFDNMASILEIDTENHVAVVQPGVTLDVLDAALAPHGLIYPVFPGEYSASLGGNVATNAGGMRAIKYGVTRHQVLGLEAVLASGEVIRTGGKFVKATTGYDLTQLIIGSEGTLAVVTEATLKLYPRIEHRTTLLAPFETLEQVTEAVPRIVHSGVSPMVLEFIDLVTMAGLSAGLGLDLGIPQEVKETALAYLVVVAEERTDARLEESTADLAGILSELGAIDVYVLPPGAGQQLIEAREKAFWVAKANGANDIIDMVVPRAQIPEYLSRVQEIARETGSMVVGCGHVGDGNVHLSVFQGDPEARYRVIHGIFEYGMSLGGAISGEHGVGTEKKRYFAELEDPVKLDLLRRIKAAFDPNGILNPGAILD